MSFLAPFFLLGGLALALPVIFHLIRRTTRERTRFSSLMFLQPSPPRLTKKSRLEHLLLLLLRCLALALLAFGFARPFLKQGAVTDTSAAPAKSIVVLVDTSASMRRVGLWEEAKARVEAVLRRASPVDRVAVLTFGRQTETLVNFEEWSAAFPDARVSLATSRLAAASPTWAGTFLGPALISAAEMLTGTDKESLGGPREIVLISDVQAGSRVEALQGYDWPKGVTLQIEPLRARTQTNAGLQLIAEANDSSRAAARSVRVRVTNSANAAREQFKVGWAGPSGTEFAGEPLELYVPPGQSRVISVPVPAGANDPSRIILRGDDDDFDNTVYAIPPAPQRLTALYLGSESADDTRLPLYFLRRALPNTPQLAVQLQSIAPNAPLPPDALASAAIVFATDALPSERAEALRAQLLAGKTVLFAPKSAASAETLARLLGLERVPLEEVKPANYAMLAEIDFQHPLFAPFADPRYSDFTKIHFWKYRRLDPTTFPQARVLARFDSRDPALLEIPMGSGRLLLLTAGWHPEDSQFAVSSKFVPLIYATLELSGAVSPQAAQSFVGDSIALPAKGTAARGPDGVALPLAPDATRFTANAGPGIYELGTAPRVQRTAVNLDAAESRTAPLGSDELERLGVTLAIPATDKAAEAERQVMLQGVEAENRQKLWRWFIVATLLVLLIESILAGRTARRVAPAAS